MLCSSAFNLPEGKVVISLKGLMMQTLRQVRGRVRAEVYGRVHPAVEGKGNDLPKRMGHKAATARAQYRTSTGSSISWVSGRMYRRGTPSARTSSGEADDP